jgi:hypothetical protein
MDFDPVSGEHAVQSAVFTILLDGPAQPSAIAAVRSSKELVAELPAIQTPQVFNLQIGGPQASLGSVRDAGIQLSHLRPDGRPAWALRLMHNELVVECSRYTRWERVWSTALKYLSLVLNILRAQPDPTQKVLVVGHAIADAFRAKREPCDLRTLLKSGPLLPERVFESGPTWHSHIGWFDSSDAFQLKSPVLTQLNVDATRTPEKVLQVQISHNEELRCSAPVAIPTVLQGLDGIMRNLHISNKAVLTELLTKEMAARIALIGSEK